MSKFEFRLPDIGEGVTEGEIVGWLVKPGDRVVENQDMVEVMTDKATVTIGAPKSGRVAELKGGVGDTIPVGEVMIVLELGVPEEPLDAPAPTPAPVKAPTAAPAAAPKAPSLDEGPVASACGDIKTSLPGVELANRGAPSGDASEERPLAAPATRRLARELGVDLRSVPASGKGGRLTREDVEAAHARRSEAPAAAPATAAPAAAQKPLVLARGADEERVAIRGLRKRISENMARSKRTAAHFTYVDECDVTALKAFRERLAPHAEQRGQKLTYLPFIVKAVVRALKRNPKLNSLVDDAANEIVLKKTHDLGIAVSTEAGLIVPVLRDADKKSVLEVAADVQRLGEAARSGKIAPEDLGGSSFTITSLGKLGGLFATPVINYPEVAILGVHEIKRKPVVRGDEIVIGEVMLLSLSFDHRIIDGDVGAAFAKDIIAALEEPDLLVLDS